MNWDWGAVRDFMPQFWDGLLVTLQALAARLADLLRARAGVGAG